MGMVWFSWKDTPRSSSTHIIVDYAGAALITSGALALLLGLSELGSGTGWWFLVASAALLTALLWVERRAADPILPLHLFSDRLFNVSILQGILAGWAVFGSTAYIPLFVQAVLGTSATQAGFTMTPMTISWVLASILGTRLLLKIGYRILVIIGMVLVATGSFLLAQININSSWVSIMLFTSLMGVGMGLSIPAFLIAVQSTVDKSDLGTATSTLQFFRSIGGTLGVSILGAYLGTNLASRLMATGIDPAKISINSLIDPLASANLTLEGPLRLSLSLTIANMFIIAFAAALAGLVVVFFAPPGKISQLMQGRAEQQSLE
jgi:Na+/melibiose symporter-like transporter